MPREVSAVAFPAYGDTEIALRSLENARAVNRKAEEYKREAGKKADNYFRRKAETEQKFRRINY